MVAGGVGVGVGVVTTEAVSICFSVLASAETAGSSSNKSSSV